MANFQVLPVSADAAKLGKHTGSRASRSM